MTISAWRIWSVCEAKHRRDKISIWPACDAVLCDFILSRKIKNTGEACVRNKAQGIKQVRDSLVVQHDPRTAQYIQLVLNDRFNRKLAFNLVQFR